MIINVIDSVANYVWADSGFKSISDLYCKCRLHLANVSLRSNVVFNDNKANSRISLIHVYQF